jgi:adenylate cyclase, class 2
MPNMSQPKIEYEAKFLNIEHSTMREKLKQLGATCAVPERTMRRVVLDYKDRSLSALPSRLRIRDEGDKVTMTYKRPSEDRFEYESEVVVDSFAQALELMQGIGLEVTTKVVNKRETWTFDGVEIVLDTWPWTHPFIEIEADSEAEVKRITELLGLDWQEAIFGDFDAVCRAQYPNMPSTASAYDQPLIDFDQPAPKWI